MIAAAWSDPGFVSGFNVVPDAALAGLGLTVAPGVKIVLVQNRADTVHLVLSGPPRAVPHSAQFDIKAFGEIYRDPVLWSLNWRARDPVARQKLIADPRGELKKLGFVYPADLNLVVLLNAADLVHLVVPEPPTDTALAAAVLDRLSDGLVPPTLRLGRLYGAEAYLQMLRDLAATPMDTAS